MYLHLDNPPSLRKLLIFPYSKEISKVIVQNLVRQAESRCKF